MKKIFGTSAVISAILFLAGCEPKPPVEKPPEAPDRVMERPPEEPDYEAWEKRNAMMDWKTYSHQKDGWQLRYPDDFLIEELDPADVIAANGQKIEMLTGTVFYSPTQENDRLSVEKYADPKILTELGVKNDQVEVRIGDNFFQKYARVGMGDGYGYVIKKGGNYFVFEATIGPSNKNFEWLMETVKFQ